MTRKILLLLCVSQGFLHSQPMNNTVTTQKGEVLTAPRSPAASTKLLFPFATTSAGFDTEIAISNTYRTVTWLVACAGEFAATLTVTVMAGYEEPPGSTSPRVQIIPPAPTRLWL